MRSRVLLVTVFMVFLFGNILIEGSVYVSADSSIDIDSNLNDYITVEPGNLEYKWIKITGGKDFYNPYLYYIDVEKDCNICMDGGVHLTLTVYTPTGEKYTEPCNLHAGIGSPRGCPVNLLWPGNWKLVDEDSGFTIIFDVPSLRAELYENFNLKITSPPFVYPSCNFPPRIRLSLIDPQDNIVSSMPPSSLCEGSVSVRDMVKENVKNLGKWELKLGVTMEELLEKGVHNEYSIPLVAYANPVIVESPSEIESLAKESDDYFTIHFRNEEDSTRGDYLVDLPCSDFKAGLYDPNGVSYDTTTATMSGKKCAIKLKVPDKARPGYWKIVVYPKDHREYSTSVEFYVSPKKERQVSVNATCGPAFIVFLAILLVLFRR